jgi:hypothetical protein
MSPNPLQPRIIPKACEVVIEPGGLPRATRFRRRSATRGFTANHGEARARGPQEPGNCDPRTLPRYRRCNICAKRPQAGVIRENAQAYRGKPLTRRAWGLVLRILGALIAIGGVSALSRDTRDVVTGLLMFAGGVALFFWGMRGTVKRSGS